MNFNDIAYIPPTVNVFQYHWDFGVQGTASDTSILPGPTFTYPDTGKYLVHLRVGFTENSNTCLDTATAWVYVYPTFTTGFTESVPCTDSEVVFNNQTVSTSGPVTSILWNFGDNTTSTVSSPTHSFATAGNYFVTLTEQNSVGCSATIVNMINVSSCVSSVPDIADEMNISLYPNPAKDLTHLHYNIPASARLIQLAVYDQLGQLLMNKVLPLNTGSFVVDVRDMANGVYNYCLLVNGQEVMHDKFLVLK